MDERTLARHIDHTVLGPTTTLADAERAVSEAADWGMNACLPPCYVDAVRGDAPETRLVTVVGFPHGQHTATAKRKEAVEAWQAGADELDVVVNVGHVKAGDDQAVRAELRDIVAAVPVPVKVIVETALLTDAEKRRVGEAARDADAAFLKTSTGFAAGGATVADVELLSEYLPVKASGGIGDYETARAMLDAGAERIGASAGVAILRDYREKKSA